MIYLLLLFIFFIAMFLYFRIADHFNIIDKPNERSSHTEITIRGGGVIYLFAALAVVMLHPGLWMPVLALFAIGTISFVDDRITLSNKIRIFVHLCSVLLVLYFLEVFTLFPAWVIVLIVIVIIGIINAYNFMDGINGITGLYSLVVLGGLQYINLYQLSFIEPDVIWLPMLASVVFLFFNFRKKAKCFAGDVGSITVALWIVFLLLSLILKSVDYRYILFLAVYGVDSVLTIIHRLMLKQNIFQAHRLHFYQIMANEQRIPHLLVSSVYALVQLLVILIVILLKLDFWVSFLLTIVPLCLLYVIVKPKMMIKS